MELKDTPTQQLLDLKKLISDELYTRKLTERAQKRIDFLRTLNKHIHPNDIRQIEHSYKASGAGVISQQDLTKSPNCRLSFLNPLLEQDWSHLFPGGDPTPQYYVYAHCDPRDNNFNAPKHLHGPTLGMPFYVGKGTGERAWDFKRNQGHGLRLKEILASGFKPAHIVHFFKRDMPERLALELEAKLVYFLGTIYEEGRKGVLLNLDLCKRPPLPAVKRRIRPRAQKMLSTGQANGT